MEPVAGSSVDYESKWATLTLKYGKAALNH